MAELKSYTDHVAANVPAVEGSGVACPDFIRAPVTVSVVRTRARQELSADGEARDIFDEYVVLEKQEEIIGPCPGELMYDVPRVQHPQLAHTARVTCAVCGWRGWI